MTIVDSFVKYLNDVGVGTLGQNIFIGEVPSSNHVTDSLLWIVPSGGSVLTKARTGEAMKQYSLNVYFRDRNYKTVMDTMFDFEELISCSGCVELEGFDIIELEVISFPIDQDLDSEDRKIGMIQINIKTYKEC